MTSIEQRPSSLSPERLERLKPHDIQAERPKSRLGAYLATLNPVTVISMPAATSGRLRLPLPEYMIPSAHIFVEKFPTSPNGKTDFKALSRLDVPFIPSATVERKLPQNSIEQALMEIWREILERHSIGTDENFFEIRGNLLSVMRVAARIPRYLGVNFPVTGLFQSPRTESLAVAIEDFQRYLYSYAELLRMLDDIDEQSAEQDVAGDRI